MAQNLPILHHLEEKSFLHHLEPKSFPRKKVSTEKMQAAFTGPQLLLMAAALFFNSIFSALAPYFSPCYQFYEARFDPSLNGLDLTRFLVETFSPHIFPPDARF